MLNILLAVSRFKEKAIYLSDFFVAYDMEYTVFNIR